MKIFSDKPKKERSGKWRLFSKSSNLPVIIALIFMLAVSVILITWGCRLTNDVVEAYKAESEQIDILVEKPVVEPVVEPKPEPKPEAKPEPKKEALKPVAKVNEEKWVSLGFFVETAYCPCYECSEGYGSITAVGRKAVEGRTIAVDPKVIPYGTEVMIDGHVYIAEDCGGAIKGNKIDIYFDTHAETVNHKRTVEVFVKEK